MIEQFLELLEHPKVNSIEMYVGYSDKLIYLDIDLINERAHKDLGYPDLNFSGPSAEAVIIEALSTIKEHSK